ncbi:hypothetical protein BsWGS_11913 [Bradybaena similaris]
MLRSGHGQLTVQLLTLASFICGALAECGSLVVFDGNDPINTKDICIKRYKTPECYDFVKSYDMNDLPADYPKSEIGVDKPEDLHLEGTEYVLENKVHPAISIRWKSPKLEFSRDRLVGFLIVWHYRESNVSCDLLLLNTSSEEIKKELSFQYEIRPQERSSFTVEVHSMPAFSTQQTDKFAVGFIVTPSAYSIEPVDIDPAKWVPFITYNASSNGTLVVRFTLAPLQFKLRKFEIMLVDGKDFHTIDTIINRPPPLSETNTHGVQVFQVSKSGCYIVAIYVKEEDNIVEGTCSCWVKYDDEERLCQTCGSVMQEICMNVTAISTTAAAIATERTLVTDPATEPVDGTTSSTTIDESHKQRMNSGLAEAIAGGLIAAFLFLLFIVCVVFCWKHGSSVYRCCKRKTSQQATDVSKSWSGSDPEFSNVVPLTKKTVYIIYARDHQPHVRLVEALIAFLDAHCRCRVISLMQCDCDESEAYQWFLARISTADYIIFINSQAAENLIVAYLSNRICRTKGSTLEDDFFQLGVKFLMNSEEVRENNLILVSFKGKSCQKYFQVSTVYTLPKDLLAFLQKLHNLKGNTKAYDDWLPLHVENIPNLPEGARLLSAIKVVEDFEDSNPGWLEKSFGPLKLLEGADDSSTGLVSTQGLTPNEFGSPVSVFKELNVSTCLHANDPQTLTAPNIVPHVQSFTNSRSYYPGKELNGGNLYLISNNLNTEDTVPWYQVNKLMGMGHAVNPEAKSIDGESLNPPETLSEILYDSYSTALAQINTNGELISHYLQLQNSGVGNSSTESKSEVRCQLNHVNELQPPETLSNVQEENMSAIFRAINANTENCLNQL